MQPLITKYRPANFSEVSGNAQVVEALNQAIHSPSCPHAFLLVGPSGVGKTTLARIIASEVKADIEELDAASNSGIDNMRQIVDTAKFQPITSSGNKMIIIDEAHGLSKQAFDSVLKLIEEPPPYLYIALCTTELSKIKETIRTRCYSVALKPLKPQEIDDFIHIICELEGWTLLPAIATAITAAATGQPRKALSILQVGHAAQSIDELASIVLEVERDDSPLLDLIRYLLRGGRDWGQLSSMMIKVDQLEEDSLEEATRYLTKIIMNSDNEKVANNNWKLLDALTFPRNSAWSKKAVFVASIGSFLWS